MLEPSLPRWLLYLLSVMILTLALLLVADRSTADTNLPRDHARVMKCHDIPWKIGSTQVRKLVRCIGDVWNVPGGGAKMVSVVSCETGGTFDHRAYNPNGHVGLMQHDEQAWRGRVSTWIDPLGFRVTRWQNAEVNAIMGALMAKADGTWSRQWPGCS